jgi:hypothetical protein
MTGNQDVSPQAARQVRLADLHVSAIFDPVDFQGRAYARVPLCSSSELKAMEWPLPVACEQPAFCEPYKLIA